MHLRNHFRNICAVFALFLACSAQAAPQKILVVVSSANKLTLRDGKTHPTGFFLNELAVPLQALIAAGYEPVFANPLGNEPVMDKNSDSAVFFGNNAANLQAAHQLLASLKQFHHPLRLSQVRKQGIAEYAGIFLPGGHAPLEDLAVNPTLGALLREFHKAGKPTALICHGPIALLSALDKAASFTKDLAKNPETKASDWIYAGYAMTVFSTAEEKQEEPGADNALGGFVKFYPELALSAAGGKVQEAGKWQSHALRDRELITGQNPSSDGEFSRLLLQALAEQKK
jgi:putative intracellular protease/amidase